MMKWQSFVCNNIYNKQETMTQKIHLQFLMCGYAISLFNPLTPYHWSVPATLFFAVKMLLMTTMKLFCSIELSQPFINYMYIIYYFCTIFKPIFSCSWKRLHTRTHFTMDISNVFLSSSSFLSISSRKC